LDLVGASDFQDAALLAQGVATGRHGDVRKIFHADLAGRVVVLVVGLGTIGGHGGTINWHKLVQNLVSDAQMRSHTAVTKKNASDCHLMQAPPSFPRGIVSEGSRRLDQWEYKVNGMPSPV